MSKSPQSTHSIVLKMLALAVGMFAFAFFVMPPLYTLLCEVTGLRKVGGAYEATEQTVDTSRLVTVKFVATHNSNMPWDFKPVEYQVKVHPGERTNINYFAKNRSAEPMVAQAVPSISPFNAVNYFHKIECFCFNHQPLAAGESAELGLQFMVDPELPKQVKTITLSYTLFDISGRADDAITDSSLMTESHNGT